MPFGDPAHTQMTKCEPYSAEGHNWDTQLFSYDLSSEHCLVPVSLPFQKNKLLSNYVIKDEKVSVAIIFYSGQAVVRCWQEFYIQVRLARRKIPYDMVTLFLTT